MKKDTQLLLALAAGLSPDHKLVQTAENSHRLSSSFLKHAKLTKEDIFNTAESGTSFFNTAETWKIMPRLLRHLIDQGETITASDFTKKIDGGNTLLGYAEKFGTFSELFDPEVWQNNLDEMEKLWFEMQPKYRRTCDFWGYYQQAAALSGAEVRESVYKKASLNVDEAVKTITTGSVHRLDATLKQHGSAFSKQDLFLLDSEGKTPTASKDLLGNMDGILNVLKTNNEQITYQDMVRKRGDNPSLFEMAVQNVQISAAFTSQIWRGQMADMMALWEQVPEEKQKAVDIHSLLTDLEDHEFSHLVDLDQSMDRDTLTSSISVSSQYSKEPKSFEICVLGLQKTWHNIWSFDANGDNGLPNIDIEDLRLPHGYFKNSVMHAAVRYGFLEVVIDMVTAKNQWFSVDDLTDKKGGQLNILEMAAKQDKLGLIMDPARWVGSKERRDDMIKTWQRLPKDAQSDYDIDQMLVKLNRLNLRNAARQSATPSMRI